MSQFFLHNPSIDLTTYNEFKKGILELVAINKHPNHLFYKHESVYELPVIINGLYTAALGYEEQEIYRFLEHLSPCDSLIETEENANNYCKSNINGLLGINFGNSTIKLEKQISNNHRYKEWCFKFLPDKKSFLTETKISPSDKKIHIAPHHGQKELNHLCDRIKNSPYVLEMQSTDWGGKHFIRKIESNGMLEIVLHKTEKEYALLVKTTGTDILETTAIAEILKTKYDN